MGCIQFYCISSLIVTLLVAYLLTKDTEKAHCALLPERSTNSYSTPVCTPTGKANPGEISLLPSMGCPLSVAVGSIQTMDWVCALVFVVKNMLPGQPVIIGGMVSCPSANFLREEGVGEEWP